MAVYTIKNLTFRYPDQDRPALDRLDFSVEKGEFLVVCGKSGCGKSTLLRHFKTAMAPYGSREGEILFDGIPLEDVSVREQGARIGYVLQSPDNQIVTDKVWHELAFGLENLGYDTGTIRLRVAEMASFFGIQTWFMKNVDELSGGQKQMMNLASVMAMQPEVLILDEPTSQLDPLAAGDFLTVLKKINDELGTTIILIEHRLEEALAYADRVLIMENGGMLALAPPAELSQLIHGNDMFRAMPVPMRIFDAAGGSGRCPVTVRQGREWMESLGISEKKELTETDRKSDRRSLLERIFGASDEKEEYVIEAKDVWFRYEKDLPDVVRDLNFQVRRGELYCLLGGNGTGKSTTLSLIAGTKRPYRGRILIDGKPVDSFRESELYGRILGILPQNPQNLFVRDTVEADLREMAPEQPELLETMIDRMELRHLLKAHPYDLSGGEQQRAAMAKVLLLEPKILLLDEPTKGLDGFYKKKLAGILKGLTEEGRTIVMVSHDIEFCAEFADTCGLFFHGSVVTAGPAKQFFRGNSFYTTAANRMARKWFPDAVTAEEVIACLDE